MSTDAAALAVPGYLAGTWKIDPAHSQIGFAARHLMITKVHGRFTEYDVTVTTAEDPLLSSVSATIDLASVDTGNPARDEHLRSADFFDVENHPTMTYASTGVVQTSHGWSIDGQLALHGITRRVPLDLEVHGFCPDPWGGQRAGFSATAEIDRRDFGIDFNLPLDSGRLGIGHTVSVSLDIQAVREE